MFTCQNSSKNDDFSNFDHKWSLFKVQRKNASIKMEKKLGYNIYQCQMVSSGVVSNGVEWCGVKWCRVSVMTLESLVCSRLFVCQIWAVFVQKLNGANLEKFSQNCHLATTSSRHSAPNSPKFESSTPFSFCTKIPQI